MAEPASESASPEPRRDRVAPGSRLDTRLEIVTAFILSVAALGTSWSSYQSELWDGEQAAHYTKANAFHTEATRLSVRAGQLQAIDAMSFAEWANAFASGQQKLEAFYRDRFRPEFKVAFDDWISRTPLRNPGAPASPFLDPKYQNSTLEKSEKLEQQARGLFEEGQRANSISDHFVQATVFLASAMFFGGICQVFDSRKVRFALIGVAVIACVLGLLRMLSQPSIQL
jgi:hypothetical protein